MWLKKIIASCTSGSKEDQKECSALIQGQETATSNIYYGLGQVSQKVVSKDYFELVQKIQNKEITLEVLKDLQQLNMQDRKSFLKYMEGDNELHEINKKVMEHALDLIDSKDSAFLLRISADAIFRDLLYLEAKGNKFTAEIDKKGTLIINFPSGVLELYKPLINNFYSKKFRDDEFRKKAYELYKEDLEKSGDTSGEALENHYVKHSLARSIMYLFVSKQIREHNVCEELFESEAFKKVRELEKFKALRELSNDNKDAKAQFNSTIVDDVLNDVNGVYINNLTHSDILELVMYSSSNNETIESIEISGDAMTFVTLV